MKDWSQFAKTCQEAAEVTGTKPSVWQYLVVKVVDNALAIAVFVFTIFFATLGLFLLDNQSPNKVNWALHAAELCLGVFLGLLKTSYKR